MKNKIAYMSQNIVIVMVFSIITVIVASAFIFDVSTASEGDVSGAISDFPCALSVIINDLISGGGGFANWRELVEEAAPVWCKTQEKNIDGSKYNCDSFKNKEINGINYYKECKLAKRTLSKDDDAVWEKRYATQELLKLVINCWKVTGMGKREADDITCFSGTLNFRGGKIREIEYDNFWNNFNGHSSDLYNIYRITKGIDDYGDPDFFVKWEDGDLESGETYKIRYKETVGVPKALKKVWLEEKKGIIISN